MSYSTQKNKLRTFWEYNQRNEIDLKNKESKLHRLFNTNSANKSITTLYDSNWITVTPNYGTFKQATKGMIVPGYVTVSKKIPIEIPEYLLPFIKTHIITQTPPTMSSHALLNYDYNYYSSPSLWNITNAGSVVLTTPDYPYICGLYRTSGTFYLTASQQNIDDEIIVAPYTKKLPKVTIEYTDGGSQYRVISYARSIVCLEPPNEWGGNDFFTWDFLYNTHKIHSINATSMNATGRYVYRVSEFETAVIAPSTKTIDFSSMDSIVVYIWGVLSLAKKIGDVWTEIPQSCPGSFDSTAVDSMTFEDSEQVLVYFDSNFDYHGGMDALYYWRNQASLHDDGSIPASGTNLSISQTRGTEKSSIPQLGVGTNRDCIVKTSLDKYLFLLDATIVVGAKANTAYPSNYNTFSLSISVDNTTPTPMVVSSNAREYYVANGEAIKYKILITCQNPLMYEDMVNYNV